MIGLLQRVNRAAVRVGDESVGEIGAGLAVLVCVERGDGGREAERLVERILAYRVFRDGGGRLNRSLTDTGGGLLLVPQFTLAADTRKGTRPSLGRAAPPEVAGPLFSRVVELAAKAHGLVASGRFGTHMELELVNDGPLTFWLQVFPSAHRALEDG